MRPAKPPLSLKDLLVLDLLKQRRPGLVDADKLARDYYRELRTERPRHWRITMMTTLQRLCERGASLQRVGGGKGAGNLRQWVWGRRQ